MSLFKTRSRFLRLLPGVVLVCGGLLVLIRPLAWCAAPSRWKAHLPPPTPWPMPQSRQSGFRRQRCPGQQRCRRGCADQPVQSAALLDALKPKFVSNVLAATEERVDSKIAQLKTLQGQIAALLVQRDAAQDKQVAALIKTYGPDGMKAANAAAIFNTLPTKS